MSQTKIDTSFLHDVEVDGIDHADAPDYCDAYIAAAYHTGLDRALTEEELDALNNDKDYVYGQVQKRLY